MGLFFGRKTYLNADKDTPEQLKIEGTKVPCVVKSIKEVKGGVEVIASPTEGAYKDKFYKNVVQKLPRGVYVGGVVNVYIDEKDADGDYYLEVDYE